MNYPPVVYPTYTPILKINNVKKIKETFTALDLPWVPTFDRVFMKATSHFWNWAAYLENQTVQNTMAALPCRHCKLKLDNGIEIVVTAELGLLSYKMGAGSCITAQTLDQLIDYVYNLFGTRPSAPIDEAYLQERVSFECEGTLNWIPFNFARKLAVVRSICYCLRESFRPQGAYKVAYCENKWHIEFPEEVAVPALEMQLRSEDKTKISLCHKLPPNPLYVYDATPVRSHYW